MKTLSQVFVCFITVQSLQIVSSKPIFKGLSFKKNYEVEIHAIPFKHISFIKEKWFPFKMIGITHDIEKREVDPRNDNLYSVNEVIDEDNIENSLGLDTSVKNNLDLNSEGALIQNPAPVVDNSESLNVPVIDPKNVVNAFFQASSVIPLSPSIIIAPSIETMGGVLQPAVVPLKPEVDVSSDVTSAAAQPPPSPSAEDVITPIQPMYTHVDVAPIDKLEQSISKLHTDISSAVPLNTLVAAPAQEMDFPLPDIKEGAPAVEAPAVEAPKVNEEIKAEPVPVVVTPVVTSVVETPVVTPVAELPVTKPIAEPPVVVSPILETLGKSGPPGLLMRGTRIVLYFGSMMLQLLSQMLSRSQPVLHQITESLAIS